MKARLDHDYGVSFILADLRIKLIGKAVLGAQLLACASAPPYVSLETAK